MKKNTASDAPARALKPDLPEIVGRIMDGFFALDKDGHCSFMNQKASGILHIDPQVITGHSIWTAFPDNADRSFYKACRNAMANQQYQCLELTIPFADRWMEYHIHPSPTGLSILFHEITARKMAEISESIINNLPGVFYIREVNGNILRWNKHLETISGYSPEEISQLKSLHFIQEKDKDLVRERIKNLLANGRSASEVIAITKDGKKIPFYITSTVVQFEGKTCMMFMGIDISETKRTQEELSQANEQLHHLSAYLQNVREEERKAIAREIHDELGQQLTALKMDISWAMKKSKKEDFLYEKLSGMNELTDHTIATIRRISSELRPSVLDDLGLTEALDWQSTEFEKRYRTETRFRPPGTELNIGSDLATGFFRIYQESLTNVARHAKAKKVLTSLERTDGMLILQVSDDGIGFDTAMAATKGTFGLLGIKERTLMMGGKCDISSSPGKGTTIRISVPMDTDH